MRSESHTIRRLASVTFAAILVITAASASAAEKPALKKVGAYIVKYDGPAVQAVLSYRIAEHSLGAPYMILQFAVSGSEYSSVEIPRDKVAVITPDGARLDLMSQKSFLDNFSAIRDVSLAAGYGDPVTGYFAHATRETDLDFFVGPYQPGVTYDEVGVNSRRVASGTLYFEVPGSVQKGKWVFQFNAGEKQVQIPFEL